MVVYIGLKDLRIPRRSDVPAQLRGCRGQHKVFDLFLLFFGEKRLSPRGKTPMKQEFQAPFVKQRHIMGNGLAAHVDHGGHVFAQIAFHDQADGHHTLAEMSVFDLPFLLAEFPGSVIWERFVWVIWLRVPHEVAFRCALELGPGG